MATFWVAMSFTIKLSDAGTVQIQFHHYIGDQLLELDSPKFSNSLGQSFEVHNFKYYIGDIHLKNKNGKEVILNNYYLVNEDDVSSKQISLPGIPEGEYSSISFMLGVDSIHNCSGAQSGALDPVHAMFWTWKTGYIFMKLDGKSSVSNSPGHLFEFHIGGYKFPNNCIRRIELPMKSPLVVAKKISSQIHIKADASEVMKAPTTIDLTKLSSVTDHNNATMIADNYMDMFSIFSGNEK